jgi:glutaredoxin-dependent peroxiredoxin
MGLFFVFIARTTFIVNQIKVGDKAPDFTLPDTELKPKSLHEFLGQKVVLAFLSELSPQLVPKKCVSFGILWIGLLI